VLKDGELQQVGTPEELYEQPANVFVGGFIGSPGMSFLPGENGEQVGVRPEHVRPWQDGLHGPIEGSVAYVEALGRETLVGIDADGTRLVAVFEGRRDLEVGAPLRVGLVPAGMQRFDARGRRA
jgi:ABC-type sugar transport system ATPase subunit